MTVRDKWRGDIEKPCVSITEKYGRHSQKLRGNPTPVLDIYYNTFVFTPRRPACASISTGSRTERQITRVPGSLNGIKENVKVAGKISIEMGREVSFAQVGSRRASLCVSRNTSVLCQRRGAFFSSLFFLRLSKLDRKQ